MPIEKSGGGGATAKLARELISATCPACGDHVAAPFYDGGLQPLATLGWPQTAEDALNLPRLPLDFVSCAACGHVFNASFDYRRVPYSERPNRMFNGGAAWTRFLETVAVELVRRLPFEPVVVEIGYGDGSFLAALSAACPAGRFIGFDPHGAPAPAGARLDLRRQLFEPGAHLAELRPDLVVSRHVLEHLSDPLGFVQHLSLAAACLACRPVVYLEVPCIDRALETSRTEDFYYEHNSHFTTASFCRMLERSGARLEALGHGYDGEVVYAFARLDARSESVRHGLAAADFCARARAAHESLVKDLQACYASGRPVAFWGGTGKSAAFLNAHQVDARRFPVVVDSDPAKAGTHVPGTGQLIRFRDWLAVHPADLIVIPCQWRAADIAAEMRQFGIRCQSILIPHQGHLVDWERGCHPYASGTGWVAPPRNAAPAAPPVVCQTE